jgi:hypothetical protein
MVSSLKHFFAHAEFYHELMKKQQIFVHDSEQGSASGASCQTLAKTGAAGPGLFQKKSGTLRVPL